MNTPEIVFSEIFTTQRLGIFSTHYHIWKLKINFILANKRIDYVLHQPQPPDHHRLHQQWLDDDTHCQSLILRAVESTEYSSLELSAKLTAKSMMDSLDSTFLDNPPTIHHQVTLFHRYIDLRMTDGASVIKHISEIRAAAYELEIAGLKVPDEMQAVVLMNSLPESWSDVAYLLNLQLDTKDELSFDNVSRKLRVAAEMRPRQMYVRGDPGSGVYCCCCRQSGHTLSRCPEVPNENNYSFESDSYNNFPFAEQHLDIWERRYHELKTSGRLNNAGTNYRVWKSSLFLVIRCLGLGYVLVQPKPSEPTDSTPEQKANDYNKWLVDDFTCRHLFLGAMEDNLLLTFQSQPTASALSSKLDDWFEYPSLGRRMNLFRQYVGCVMSDDAKINDHICNLQAMVEEVRGSGIDVSKEIEAVVLINSLPRSWNDTTFMFEAIDGETRAGKNLLDTVIRNARIAGRLHPPEERSNSKDSNNYQKKTKKRKRYNRRY